MSATDAPPPLRDAQLSVLSGVEHGFTLRAHGDAALGPQALRAALGGEVDRWTRREVEQVHGGVAVLVAAGMPATAPRARADALVTAEPGELLIVRTADCLPVLIVGELFDEPVAVGALHVGWRGLVAGVLDRSLDLLERVAPTARLRAAFGPAIGPCCFEIGPEVAEPFAGVAGLGVIRRSEEGDRSRADLPGAARRLLEMREVLVQAESPPCTRCRPELFHSHRAEGAKAGRMASFIGLRP